MTLTTLSLFDTETRLDRAFADFHELNPDVYDELVALARKWKQAGHRHVGISMLFELIRWSRGLSTVGDTFRLNNSYRSRYARLIMAQEADLRDFFETRELRS